MSKTIRARADVFGGLIVGLAGLTVPGAVSAVVVENLYTVTVPLSSEDPQDRRPRTEEDYLRLAMGELLTRVTGQLDAAANPALEDLVRDAGRYVVQRGNPDRENLLLVFDGRGLQEALTRRNQPVWGEERPLTLLWVAIDGGFGERRILASDPSFAARSGELEAVVNELREQLRAVAAQRGLPITLPLMDLEDMGALDFTDVWGGFGERVSRASERYAPDAVLSARVRLDERGVTTARWTLLRGTDQVFLPGDSVRSGLDGAADLYAREFSGIGGAVSARITVVGVETLDDYGRVMSYLERLSVLDSVQMERMAGAELTLRVAARGGSLVLERVLALGDVLKPLPATDQGPDGGELIFSLAP